MEASKNYCRECGNTLMGRSDKRYCDDYCRNKFHNKINSEQNRHMYEINRILKKNRSILEQLLIFNTPKASREGLLKMGFDFNYFTSQFITKDTIYNYCYDLGYLEIENGFYSIVLKKSTIK